MNKVRSGLLKLFHGGWPNANAAGSSVACSCEMCQVVKKERDETGSWFELCNDENELSRVPCLTKVGQLGRRGPRCLLEEPKIPNPPTHPHEFPTVASCSTRRRHSHRTENTTCTIRTLTKLACSLLKNNLPRTTQAEEETHLAHELCKVSFH